MDEVLSFFGLKEKPFSLLPNPRFMYLADPYREVKAKLLYFLNDRSASLYLYGPVGSGKTTLLRLLADEVDGSPKTVGKYLIAPNLKTSNQLLRRICEEFGVKTDRSYDANLRNFESFLIEQAKADMYPLLLIDEAQNLTRDELKLIHYLLNFVSNTRVLLMIVMVGQPELADKINRFPSLKSRLISSSVSDLTREDCERLIRFRWSVASGGSDNAPFGKDAVDMIYTVTLGNPRQICKLCDAAVLRSYLKQSKEVTAEIVKQTVAEENLK